jgi:hypothetical protein
MSEHFWDEFLPFLVSTEEDEQRSTRRDIDRRDREEAGEFAGEFDKFEEDD